MSGALRTQAAKQAPQPPTFLGLRRHTLHSSRERKQCSPRARQPPSPWQPPHLCPRPAACYSAPRPARWPGGWCLGLWQAWLGAGASLALSRSSAAGRSPCRGCSACSPKGHVDKTDKDSLGRVTPRQHLVPDADPPTHRSCPRRRTRKERGESPSSRKQDREAHRSPPLDDTRAQLWGDSARSGAASRGKGCGARAEARGSSRKDSSEGNANEAKHRTKAEFRKRRPTWPGEELTNSPGHRRLGCSRLWVASHRVLGPCFQKLPPPLGPRELSEPRTVPHSLQRA